MSYIGQKNPLGLRDDKRTVHRVLGDLFRAGRKAIGGKAGLGVGGVTHIYPLVDRHSCWRYRNGRIL